MTKNHDVDNVIDEDVPLYELRARASVDSANSSDFGHLLSEDGSEASSTDLPPVDGGRDAWMFLFGLWLLEAMAWGFPLSFGVFQNHYSNHELFKDSNSIPTIGTLAAGISYLGMPLTNPIAIRWPQHRRKMVVLGFSMCLFGLIGASFAQRTWHLLVFQGAFYGTGWVVCYTPFLFMLNEWFVDRRGLAYGILFGASGVSGLIIPFAANWMLQRFGFRNTLRVYAVATAVISGPGLLLVRPRLPAGHSKPQQQSSGGFKTILTYCKNINFLLLAAAVFLQGLGFFIPNIFITSFAQDLGQSSTASSSLLALISFSQVLGQLWQGWISDRVSIYIPAAVSTLAPGLGALLLWGPGKGMAFLAPFALIWGFFSASYTTLFTRMCSTLIPETASDTASESIFMLLYAFFSVERGISSFLQGPISSWLMAGKQDVDMDRFGLDRYAGIVWFTVFCMLSSSATGVGLFWRKRR